MTVTIKSENLKKHYIEICQEKYSSCYKVQVSEDRGGLYYLIDEKIYGTEKQANRRYNNMKKLYNR